MLLRCYYTVFRKKTASILFEIFIQIGYIYYKSYARKQKWLFFEHIQYMVNFCHNCYFSTNSLLYVWFCQFVV